MIDSRQWSGTVHRGADGLVWHNHYRLDRILETIRWEAQVVGRILGTHTAAVVCVHGAHVQGAGLEVQGVAIVPAHLLRSALGDERVLSDANIDLLAATARARLPQTWTAAGVRSALRVESAVVGRRSLGMVSRRQQRR